MTRLATTLKTIIPAIAAVIAAACSGGQRPEAMGKTNEELRLDGDKTIYGLACEGCSDSVVVLLPSDGSDPVRYDILDATRRHNVKGNIKTGDWIGLVTRADNPREATLVVDLDQLKGIWCYIVMPRPRGYEQMTRAEERRAMAAIPDSLRDTYLVPREYGFYLRRHWQAQSVGYVSEGNSLADESPVAYPQLGYFTEWHIWNGQLVMVSGKPDFTDTKGVSVTDIARDTCSIDYLGGDSLVLSSDGISRSYYRKADIQDVNKRARALAEQRARQAIEQTKEDN